MVKFRIIYALAFLFISLFLEGQDLKENLCQSDSAYYHSFFPMHVGDKWVYKSYSPDIDLWIQEVVTDTIDTNGTHWFMYHKDGSYYRINDSFEVIYKGAFSWEHSDTLYKLNADTGECWDIDRKRESGMVDTIRTVNYYGIRQMLIIDMYFGPAPCDTSIPDGSYLWAQKTFLVSGIGMVEQWYEGGPGRYLIGAIVDGVVYGNPNGLENSSENVNISDYLKLFPCYPNPFNNSTTISYLLLKKGYVVLNIYDLKGNLIQTLVNQIQNEGSYNIKWNCTNINNQAVQSGLYFYEIIVNRYKTMRKMILLK